MVIINEGYFISEWLLLTIIYLTCTILSVTEYTTVRVVLLLVQLPY